jgi:hypothetical protein
LSKFIPDKHRVPADEEWFKNNGHRIP